MYEICERLFEQNGYVKWADVGKALGVSRQAIQLRLRAAQRRGELDDATYVSRNACWCVSASPPRASPGSAPRAFCAK
jgi:hypothetical protein